MRNYHNIRTLTAFFSTLLLFIELSEASCVDEINDEVLSVANQSFNTEDAMSSKVNNFFNVAGLTYHADMPFKPIEYTNNTHDEPEDPGFQEDTSKGPTFVPLEKGKKLIFPYYADTKARQHMKIVGYVNRTLPEVSDRGFRKYPMWNVKIENSEFTAGEIDQLYEEVAWTHASEETFDSVSKDGYRMLKGVKSTEKLYKHTASVGLYFGDVADDELAVIADISVEPRPVGNYITGLYAPPGEIIEVNISQEVLDRTGGIRVYIGQASQRGAINVINRAYEFIRFPRIATIFNLTNTSTLIGSYFGGPIYVEPMGANLPFAVRISGAVEHVHFIKGVTTIEHYNQMVDSCSAPFFMMEVWDNSYRMGGSKYYVNLEYDNMFSSLNLWEKITYTSKQVPSGSRHDTGITFVFDAYVFGGSRPAAVASVGHNWVNCPSRWIKFGTDYSYFTTTSGGWGDIHEYDHHFQRWGFGGVDEVGNNAINLCSYILYTQISSFRSLVDTDFTDWQRYTDPSRSLRHTLEIEYTSETAHRLENYADVLHTFGVDNFLAMTQYHGTLTGANNWYDSCGAITGYDFSYYYIDLLKRNVSEEIKARYVGSDHPIFVPVATIFQTGRSYMSNGKEVFSETVKPFRIPHGQPFVMNFEERLIVPPGFSYTLSFITQPPHGTLTKINDTAYTYTPETGQKYSGVFKMKVHLTHSTISTPDITFTINLEQEKRGMTITRYQFSNIPANTNCKQMLDSNYEGYSTMTTEEVQTTAISGVQRFQVAVLDGKVYPPCKGRYLFSLSTGVGTGGNNAVFLSRDEGRTYEEIINYTGNKIGFALSGVNAYEINVDKGECIYFKVIFLLWKGSNGACNLGWTRMDVLEPKIELVKRLDWFNIEDEAGPYNFTSPQKYKRHYYTDRIPFDCYYKVTACNIGENSTHTYEKMFDGDKSTYYFSDKTVNVTKNPIKLNISLRTTIRADTVRLCTHDPKAHSNFPSTFLLYVGTSYEDEELVDNRTLFSLAEGEDTLDISFPVRNVSYIYLYCSKGYGGSYFMLSEVEVFCTFKDGEEFTPDYLTYYGFDIEDDLGTFGHLVKGNGTIEYKFKGKQFGLFARQKEDCKISVNVDGVEKEYKGEPRDQRSLIVLTDELAEGTHSLVIEVLEGYLEVDAFIVR